MSEFHYHFLILEKENMLNWNAIQELCEMGNHQSPKRVEKSLEEWKAQLSEEVFRVTRQSGTESPHSSDMCTAFEPGIYACICCNTALFDSSQKFDSGTGWPSFNQPLEKNLVAYFIDNSLSRTRVETKCNICDAHLGHVFPDGPEPSGLRYCINALALKKIEQ